MNGQFGVVTACDAAFFPGAQMLWFSLRGEYPLALFDLGLHPEQVAWCRGRMRVLPCGEGLIPRGVEGWQTWNKPCYIERSPFRCPLWLDADCLVVAPLEPLFVRAEQGPFV